ncbi:MAG TPA: cbb3-type cytochrome c oxidase subunit I [Vicinamibacteria bacterium]|nr:cbb3-type cytochrome c oxidase subunit I [Vicinamibacteria bacterium]
MSTANAAVPSTDTVGLKRLTLVWVLTALVLFPVLALLGAVMRLAQANLLPDLAPEWFYAVMTLHGLGMVGLWFVAAMAAVSYLLAAHVNVRLGSSRFAYGATLLGVILLILATLVGRLGVGWYFLYPLPFFSGGTWPDWATGALFAALAVLGVGWTVWAADLLWAIARRYPLSAALGWPHLVGRPEPSVPPIVVICTVSFIAVLAGLVAAVVILLLLALERLGGGAPNDALLMKNLTFYFGHVLVNITMYLGVALVYEILPEYTQRPWKTNRLVALAWNSVLFLVMFAYLHHLYMDFVQPRWLQALGQVSSYLISVPAAVVTIFSTLVVVYGAKMRWGLASLLLYLGVMGWAVGGVAAVIDSTVAVNARFHNTLWVPAHFHSYYLMGVVLMILGAVWHVLEKATGLPERPGFTWLTAGLVGLGGYGFLATFYVAGATGVPRRFATYPAEVMQGATLAQVALVFVALLLAGALLYIWETGRRCLKAFAS